MEVVIRPHPPPQPFTVRAVPPLPSISPPNPPVYPNGEPPAVKFKHPGYPHPQDIIFQLAATDPGPHVGTWGIHHSTILAACSILCSNINCRVSTRILTARECTSLHNSHLTDQARQEVLVGVAFWVYPEDWLPGSEPYPIVPDFDNWQFPHDNLPNDWSDMVVASLLPGYPESNFTDGVSVRDQSCCITGFPRMSCEAVHLVPREYYNWFRRNGMAAYNSNKLLAGWAETNDTSNGMLLRADLHRIFDRSKIFLIVPKLGSMVVHFLDPAQEYGQQLQNATAQHLACRPEFLYARFAWVILARANVFSHTVKWVLVYDDQKVRWVKKKRTVWEKMLVTTKTHESKKKRVEPASGSPATDEMQPCQRSQVGSNIDPMMRAYNLCLKNPEYAYHHLSWHPETPRFQALSESWLSSHEPELHQKEQERLARLIAEDRIIWDEEYEEMSTCNKS